MWIKRYRLSVSVNSGRPELLDYEHWPRERTPHLHEFRPIAERYRQRKRKSIYLLVGFMLGGFLLMKLSPPGVVLIWGLSILMSALLLSVVIFAFGLRLKCPACKKRLEPAKGPYCPQCGSDQFQRTREPYCPSCNSSIGDEDSDSSRNYRIRGCTHCGVMLDEIGL